MTHSLKPKLLVLLTAIAMFALPVADALASRSI
jgi:hypothetical protein